MSTVRVHTLLLTCSAIAMVAFAAPAGAQDATQSTTAAQPTTSGEDTDLKPIVLQGQKAKTSRKGTIADTPLASETTQKTITDRDIQSLDDLGNTVEPGVSYVGATKSVNIRGLEDDRVLTTIDGIPVPYLSDAVRGAVGGVDSYDFSSLSTIDIVRGGDSSRAGSGALGGAVVLRTLEPADLIQPGKTWGGIAKLTYDSADKSFQSSAAVAKKVENTSIMFQGSYQKGHEKETNGDIGGFGSTRTEADPMDYNKSNLLFKLRQDLEGGHQIGVTAEHYNYNSSTNLKEQQGASYAEDDYWRRSDMKRDRVSLDYKFNAESAESFIDSAWASLYWQKAHRIEGTAGDRLTDPIGEYDRTGDKQERDFGFVGAATGNYDLGATKHEVTLGTDIQFFKTHQHQNGYDTCSITYSAACAFYHNNQSDEPDVDGTKVGLYLDDKISIGDHGFSLTPGIRYDWFDYKPQATESYTNNSGYSGLPNSMSDSQFSPKLRAAWQVQPDVELFAQWSMGFKAPNASQLYSNYDNAPLYRQIGNPDLKSETSSGFEVGANLGNADLGGSLTGFYNKYRNFIDTSTTADPDYAYGTIQYFNRAHVKIYGFEAKAHKSFSNGIYTRAALSYARGEDEDTGDLISSVPPFKGILAVGFQKETWGTELQFTGVAGVSDSSTVSFKAPGYGLFNLTGWWEPEQVKGLRVQAGVYNIFDKTNWDALETKDLSITTASANKGFYSEPGRTFKISLTQRF